MGAVELEDEVRFWLDQDALRITYWIATDRRIVLLTVFRKSRMREVREIDRAVRADRRCVREAHLISGTEEDDRGDRADWMGRAAGAADG